jgi:cytochrome c peroxidase
MISSLKKYPLLGLAACVIATATIQSCNKKDAASNDTKAAVLNLPETPFNYNITYPAHVTAALATQDNTPVNNVITNDGATLGRVLFYDKNLSKNNTISCASCHQPGQGFTDAAILSKGFEGVLTTRHSMSLLNTRFYRSGKMFWDERAATLEDQVLQPIQNAGEMGLTLSELQTKISSQSYYPTLFKNAFGSSDVSTDRISKALSQFIRSIVTYQSKYDRVKQGQEAFTQIEQAGEQIFQTPAPGTNLSCNSCHTAPMFITSNPAAPFALPDPNDRGINNQNRFKSGSLRNIATAASLFHNGSVPGLQAMFAGNIPAHNVAPQDRARILAFMQTLTDNTIATEAKFATPFK